MCGIFGIVSDTEVDQKELKILAQLAQQRGKDSSGLIQFSYESYSVYRSDYSVLNLLKEVNTDSSRLLLGHSRLITNGHSDNQPVLKEDIMLLHNGIIVNDDDLWMDLKSKREQNID